MSVVQTLIGNVKGPQGATGAQGAKGDQGDAATIQVGTVTTVAYGQTANVVNSGTSGAAVFDFTIPQGKPGEQTTDMQNLTLGSITASSASFPVPSVGETGKVLWGKVVKWFSDMSALVATKLNASNVVNNLTTTDGGYALDARQGKALHDAQTWTLIGSASGNTAVSLPESYQELYIRTMFTSASITYCYHWYLLRSELGTDYRRYLAGFNNGQNNLAFLYARKTSLTLTECTFNGTNVTANCQTAVFYR